MPIDSDSQRDRQTDRQRGKKQGDSLENTEQGDRNNQESDGEVENADLLSHHDATVAVEAVPPRELLPVSLARLLAVVSRIWERGAHRLLWCSVRRVGHVKLVVVVMVMVA